MTLWSIGVAGAGMVFAGEALSSHPAAAAPIFGLPIGTLADLIHLMATGAWVGGLLYIAAVLLPLLHAATLTARDARPATGPDRCRASPTWPCSASGC